MSDTQSGLERLHEDILRGQLTRRDVLKRSVALGLSAPIVAGLLAACGDDDDDGDTGGATATTAGSGQTGATATTGGQTGATTPTTGGAATQPPSTAATATTGSADAATATSEPAGEAGGHGMLRLLWWQAPTILNPHLAQGTKDFDASQICLEPLANYNTDGELVPFLAADIPSFENGDLAEDGLSVTWRLREGVTWHDGEPFDAEDVKFTWEWIVAEGNTATTLATYTVIDSVEVVDAHTVTVQFKAPNPAWFNVFMGPNGMILPQHIYKDHMGATSRDAPANLLPIGTGPFKVREFRPDDVVLYDRNEDYWDPGKPHFDQVEMKGGGDSQGTVRAVLETNEGDWAWNVQVEPEILRGMLSAGNGVVVAGPGTSTERILVNFADPNTEVDGARSEPSTPHPIFSKHPARQALATAIQRDIIATQLYGEGTEAEAGKVTANLLVAPERFRSPNTSWEYNPDKARELLQEAGVTGGKLLYQTSVNSVRQKTQEIVKANLEDIGFEVELKAISAAVYFSSDPGNPDTYGHFYADLEMYTTGPSSPYDLNFMSRYRSDQLSAKANNWSLQNHMRYVNPEQDKLHDQAATELDPAKQEELFIAMNDLAVEDVAEVSLVHRATVSAAANSLKGYSPAAFMSNIWNVKDWSREE